jgi:uncharacterized protein YkwD
MKLLALLPLAIASAAWSAEARADNAGVRVGPDTALGWAPVTFSPQSPPAITEELQRRCGVVEAGLTVVARQVAERKAKGLAYLDVDGLAVALRAAGEPHVWPRAWIVSGKSPLDEQDTRTKLDVWRRSFSGQGERRCGVATASAADGSEVVAAVALDVLADLTTPLPTRTRAGTWLTIEAKLVVPASAAKVVVVAEGTAPRTLVSSFDVATSRVKAKFAPDRPGTFTVQVLADVAGGPRPVLEARVFADVEPPTTLPDTSAPGESAGANVSDPATALAHMVDALRAEQKLKLLARDPRLDAVALEHARKMKDARTVAHDVGDGGPADRLQNANVPASVAGENVARAASAIAAHRMLWASPSHRANLVRADFDRLGVGVVPEGDGTYWVVELFAR